MFQLTLIMLKTGNTSKLTKKLILFYKEFYRNIIIFRIKKYFQYTGL